MPYVAYGPGPYAYGPGPYPTGQCMFARTGIIRATTIGQNSGQATGVRVDSNIANSSNDAHGAGKKFQLN